MKLYGVENRRVLDFPPTPYPSLLTNLIVNNSELKTGGVENKHFSSGINTIDTLTCTDVIPTYILLTNSIVNDDAL